MGAAPPPFRGAKRGDTAVAGMPSGYGAAGISERSRPRISTSGGLRRSPVTFSAPAHR